MNFDAFIGILPTMGIGMLGIFAVTAVIILCVLILNALTGGKKN